MEKKKIGYGLWSILVKPSAVILAIIIFVFILQAIVGFSNLITWISIGILSLLWLAYYFKFEFNSENIKTEAELPDEV